MLTTKDRKPETLQTELIKILGNHQYELITYWDRHDPITLYKAKTPEGYAVEIKVVTEEMTDNGDWLHTVKHRVNKGKRWSKWNLVE